MTNEELHRFGIELILPYLEKGRCYRRIGEPRHQEQSSTCKQALGKARIHRRADCLLPVQGRSNAGRAFFKFFVGADNHGATAFFASVGVACATYPAKSPVTTDADTQLPIRDAGFYVSYPGL